MLRYTSSVSFVTAPLGYVVPAWPGFYVPSFGGDVETPPKVLYDPYNIWRYTLLWTLLFYGIVFALCGLAFIPAFSRRHFRLSLLAPVIAIAFGLFLATFSATIVGFGIAAIYASTGLGMSTLVPALYALAATLGLILSSYTTVRGMM